jgi:hypothetical protein
LENDKSLGVFEQAADAVFEIELGGNGWLHAGNTGTRGPVW